MGKDKKSLKNTDVETETEVEVEVEVEKEEEEELDKNRKREKKEVGTQEAVERALKSHMAVSRTKTHLNR